MDNYSTYTDFDFLQGLDLAPGDILAAIPNAVFATDKQMRIVYFNPAAVSLTGFRRQEALGMFCRDVFKSTLCEHHCLIKRALDSGHRLFHVKSQIRTAEGQDIGVLANASLLRNSDRQIVGYLVILQDISDLQRMVKELEKTKAELERQNRYLIRTHQELKLTQQHLIQTQKMESLGRLSGGMAHHFNNILCEILGYVELLRNQKDHKSKLEAYLKKIERSVLKAVNLVQKILTFSQDLHLETGPLDLNRLVYEMTEVIQASLAENITLKLELSENLPLIKGDAHQIYHAIFNLCLNAQDAMPAGGVLTIKTYVSHTKFVSGEDDRDYVVVCVKDTGIGVKTEIRDKIFDPFFTTKEPGEGIGLGLSVVHGIAKAHGGHITFKTSAQGTEFFLYLPAEVER